VLSIGPNRTLDVSSAVTATASELLASSGVRVLASEPDYRLTAAGLERRELIVDATSPSLPITGALGVRGGKVVGALRGVIPSTEADAAFAEDAGLPPLGTEANIEALEAAAIGAEYRTMVASSSEPVVALAYSAIRNEAFALVRHGTDRPARLYRWSARLGAEPAWPEEPQGSPTTGVWTWQPTQGAALGTPLSLVVHLEQGALYVLDQPDNAPTVTRLVRIDLVTGEGTVVAKSLLEGSYGARSLSMAYRGGLLLAATRLGAEDQVELAHLDVDGSCLRVRDRFEAVSSLRDTARENASGVYYLRKTPDGVTPEHIPFDAFTPTAMVDAEPVCP
jgi:hypothetical protein